MGEADSLVVDVEVSKLPSCRYRQGRLSEALVLTAYRTLRLVRFVRWPVISAPINVVSVALTVDPLRNIVAGKVVWGSFARIVPSGFDATRPADREIAPSNCLSPCVPCLQVVSHFKVDAMWRRKVADSQLIEYDGGVLVIVVFGTVAVQSQLSAVDTSECIFGFVKLATIDPGAALISPRNACELLKPLVPLPVQTPISFHYFTMSLHDIGQFARVSGICSVEKLLTIEFSYVLEAPVESEKDGELSRVTDIFIVYREQLQFRFCCGNERERV